MSEVVEFQKLKYEKATSVEGFPGVGLVGHIAASYIVSQLELPQVGFISSDKIPPISFVLNGGILPPLRIHARKDLIIFISDLPVSDDHIFEITNLMAKYMKEIGVEKSISLGGIGTGTTTGKVFAAATDESLLKDLKDVKILEMGSIGGASGSLLTTCQKEKIPAFGFLAETVGNVPDPRAAVSLVEVLNNLLKLKIDTKPLIKEAEVVEERYRTLSDQIDKERRKREYSDIYG